MLILFVIYKKHIWNRIRKMFVTRWLRDGYAMVTNMSLYITWHIFKGMCDCIQFKIGKTDTFVYLEYNMSVDNTFS